MANGDILSALDLIAAGGFRLGSELDEAHAVAQAHEGEAPYDWLHALVHRIEGDDMNAGYWYRRAGQVRHPGSVAEEWQILRAAVEGASGAG